MNATSAGYEVLLQRFISWAQGEENIRAAFVFGSRARDDRPADEWSDLDLLFLAERPQIYMEATDWLLHIGNPWLSFLERTPDGGFERRVLFEGGLDVDFVPASIAGFRQQLAEGLPAMGIDILRRGFTVLIDKDGLAGEITAVQAQDRAPVPSSETEYLNVVNDFWYHTVWTVKHLRRGELWWAKSCCDSYLKNLLLQMLELHARASNGPDFDTWMRGRFLEAWADPRAVAALPQIFAHYEEVDIGRALLATMELFRWLALETADIFGYAYPVFGDERCSELVRLLFCSRPAAEQTGS
jgi:aminoglycoside 6-adenylyltransferase